MSLTLEQWRRAKKISMLSMANELNININTYANWEKKPQNISISNAYKIADILGEPVDNINFMPTNLQNVE